jgi:hypothetical protein
MLDAQHRRSAIEAVIAAGNRPHATAFTTGAGIVLCAGHDGPGPTAGVVS